MYLLAVVILAMGAVFAVRFSRWLAFVQQKEYRLDRLWLFLSTTEGKNELVRLTTLQDWSRTGFKRPHLTLRLLITAIFSLLLILVLLQFLVQFFSHQESLLYYFIFALLIALVFVPSVVICCAVIPTFLLQFYTRYLLFQAAQKLAHHKPFIIGITGSYGKTATKLLLSHVLSQKWSVFMPPRSHNTIYSISKSILNSYIDQKFAIIEYAAYRMGEIAVLAKRLKPQMAIITGLTEQHLGLFGSLQNIIKAKSELIAALGSGGKIFYANSAAEEITQPGLLDSKVVVRLSDFPMEGQIDDTGKLKVCYKNHKINTKLIGLQYLDTIRTVWSVARDLGMSEAECIAGLESFVPPANFTQSYDLDSGAVVLDDGGTSNAAGFSAVLDLAENLEGKKKILVTSGIVDLGEESARIHEVLATKSSKICAEVWYVGTAGLSSFTTVFGNKLYTDKTEIIGQLNELKKGDMVVIEGRMPAWFLQVVQSKRK